MALSEWARSIAERQAVEKSAKNGEYAAGGVHYLDIKDFAQVANYKAQQKVADFYNTTSGLQWLSKDDEEKRRKQLDALRNDSLVRARKDLMSVLDYTDSQISNASRYRSYDEWGQGTGDKTYMGQLQDQLDGLESQLNELQGKDINLLKLGWSNLTKNGDLNGDNPSGKLDLTSAGLKQLFGRDDDSTEAKLADALAQYKSTDSKLKTAALNAPSDRYTRFDSMTNEELALAREELEREYTKDVEENPWKNLTNEQAMQIVQGGGASSLRSEAKTTPNEIRYIDQLLERRERQAAFDELYANKLNDPNFDGSYDSNVDDVEYKLVNDKLEGMEAVGSAQYKLNNPVNQMTDEERSIYNSIYKNEGREAASEFLSFLNEDLNLRQRLEDEATAREYAQESPVGASFLSVISRLASPVEAGAQITHLAMGDYDENAYYNAASRFTTNVRDQVSRDISMDSGEAWAWVYNTGMSVADNLAQMGLGGGAGTLMMMGTAVFSDALVQGRDAGLSDSEIIADATVRALIEIATEKIGLDEVMKVVKGAGGMQVLRAALAEGGEEAMSNLGNLFYDEIKATVTGRESEIKEEVEKLMDAGYSESEAAAIVIGNKAKDLGLDTLSGFVSGFAMAGGSYAGSITIEKAERYANETLEGTIERALKQGDDSDVYKIAEQLQNEPPSNRIAKEIAKITLIDKMDRATTKLLKESTDAYAKELESVDVEELPKKVEEIANRIFMESKGATQEASTEVDEEGNETKETKEKSDLGKTDILLAALGMARTRVFQNKLRDQILKTNATTEEGSVDMADKILRLGENATIQLSNGEIIDLNNLDFKGDGALNAAYKNAVQGLRRTSDANTYIADFKSLNGQVSAQFFDTLWKTAHKMYGATVENVKSSEAVATLLSAYEEVARAEGVAFDMSAIDTVIKHAQQMGSESAIKVTEASKKLVNEMAALTNTKVEFVDNLVDKDGNSVQGLYDTETKTIKISTTTRNPATVVFCHELTHALQDSNPTVYKFYKQAVLTKLQENTANYTFIEEQVKKAYGEETSREEIEDEIVAIASENFLVESAFVDRLKKNKNLFRKIRGVILNRYQRVGMDIVRNRMNDVSKEDYEWYKKLTELWVDMATEGEITEAIRGEYRAELFGDTMPNGELTDEAKENVKEKVEKQEIVTPQAETQFSREFDADFMDFADAKNIMSDTEYRKYKQIRKSKGEVKAQEYLDEIKDKVRNNLKKAAREALVDEATMQKAREVRNNTKQLLEQYKRFLPEDKMGKDWKTKNGSYDISGDLGTVCVRSLAVEPLMDFIADRIGHPLTAEETTFISQELMNYTHVPPCVYCYVAMDRNAKRDFLNAFINWREDTISNFRSGMAEEDVKKAFLKYNYKSGSRTMNDKLKARYNLWKKMAFDPSYEKISKADLTSVERMEERSKVSKSFAEQIKDAQDYAQSASYAKGVIGYTAYNNEILNWTPKRIRDLNAQYGMRMYSFTDYHPAFVLENMQMITDAAVKGLKVLAYTKEIDFARIFMRTGANINISIFAQSKMVDGTFHQDGMMGADWEQAKKARAESNKYGGNVGITMVAINDEQVEWACQQDWIDVVIPFHTVKAEQFADLNKWQNFKGVQEEKKLTKSDADYWAEDESWTPGDWKAGMKKEIMPQDHGNDYDTYIQACKDNHLKPKFEKWYQKWGVNGDATTRNWYMKLVVETRRSYTETLPVQPIFNEAAVEESIRKMNKPYDAPIGATAEGYEDITIEEIASEISEKMGSQTFDNSRLSRGFEDVGYHAGDLGKAESLFDQSGSRDTGHFGTGTYFVGNEEQINRHDYGKRPHEKVNFEKYNLFKPKNYSDANKLHQFMRRVDGWIGQYEGARSASEYNNYKGQLEDATYEFSDNGQQETIDDIDAWFFSDFEAGERRSDSEIIDDVVRLARLTIGSRDLARVIADHSNREVYSDGDSLILNDGIYETEFTPEEYLKRVPRDMAENIMDWVSTEANDWRSRGLDRARDYETWHNDFEDVANILGVSIDTLENAITEATQEADAINYPESMTSDSIATRVMKRLGYEGVDVRHINDMDNTMYGSVIYDLKGEDLARKQEIGTARFSKEFTDEETNAVSSNDIKRVADVLSDADVSKVKLSDEQVRKIAERILRGRGSEYSTDDLAANLKKAFAYWTQHKGTNYAALVQVMQDFMMPVVESIYDYSGDQRRRDTLIGTTFVVSEEAAKKADIKNINRRLFGYGIAFTTDAESVSSDREVVNLAENWYHETTDGSVEGVAIDLNIDHTLTDEAEMVEAIRDFVTTERGEAATQVVSPQFREGYAFDLALEAFQEFINESRVSIDEISRRANADAGKLVRENKNLRSRNAHLHDRIDQLRNEYKEKYLNMVAKNKDIIDRKKSSLQEQADKAKQLDRLQREWKRLDNYVNKPNKGRHINASYKKYLEYIADMVDLTTNRKSKRNDALDALADEYRRLSKLEQYEDRPYDDTIEMKLREVNDMVAGRPIRELNSSEIKEVVDVIRAFIKRATTMDEFTQRELARKYETVQEASRQTINNINKSRGLTNKDSLADKWLTMQLSPMREVERLTDFHADDPLFLAAENILRAEIKVNEYKMNFALMFKEMQPNQYKKGTDEWRKAKEFRKRYDKMNETYVKVRLGGVEREITEAQKLELIMQSRNEDSMRHILFGGLLVPDLEQLKKGHWNTAYTSGTIVRPFEIEMLRLSKGLDEFQKWFLDRSVKYFDYASKLINQTSFELEGFARAEVENYYPIRVATNYTSQKNYDVLTGMQDSGESIDSDLLKARVKSKLPIYLNGINQSLQRHQNFVSRYAALAIPMSDFQKIYGAKVREEAPKYYHDVLETINSMKGGSLIRDDIVKDFKEKFFMVTDADGNVVTGELKKEVLKAGNNKRGTRVQIGDNTYNIENNVNEALEWSGITLFLENRGKNVTKGDILDFINNRGTPELNPVKTVLEAKWGHHATNYLNNALKDLAGNRPVEQGLLDKARGNAAQAILTLNPSVSIKQAASFPTAIAELDYISVSHALMRGGRHNWMLSRADHDLINKYTGVLYGRQMGMTTQEIAEMSTNTNKNAINKAMDAVPWLTNWIQKIDVATVGRLWYATEYWVQRHNQDYKSGKLKKGSDEYYQVVARKFEMVVTKTQPNYSVFTRPDILRSKNQLTRAVMMFKTQPLQNFNIMYESVARVNAKIRQYNQVKGTPQANAVRGELNAAWAKLARSISSQLLQTAVFTGMTFLANALILHRWDKYKDEEINEVTFASVMEQVMWDYLGSFFGNAVGGDWFEDVAEYVIRKFAFDEDVMLNGISVMGIDTINDTYELIEKITKGIQNGDPTAAWKNVIKMAQKMAAVWGIPAENILKVFESAWLYKQDIFDDYELTDVNREGIPVLFNFQETNTTQYWNRVIRAYEEGDAELVKERFKDMIENTTETETDENGKEKTKIKAVGALSKDDTEGIMEWVANKYINGTATEKRMVEEWLEELYQYSGKPEQSIKSKKRSFYEFLGEEDKMPVELKTDDELTPAELEARKEQKKEEKWQETVATVKASVSPMSTAVSNWSSGRGYSLPIEKGDDGCGAVMAWVYQNSSDKEAVKRFAVEVMGYSQKAINRTASEWANKDLSDFK